MPVKNKQKSAEYSQIEGAEKKPFILLSKLVYIARINSIKNVKKIKGAGMAKGYLTGQGMGPDQIDRIADSLRQLIADRPYARQTINRIRVAEHLLRLASLYIHRIDWLLSNDDSEHNFYTRLDEDIQLSDWRFPIGTFHVVCSEIDAQMVVEFGSAEDLIEAVSLGYVELSLKGSRKE